MANKATFVVIAKDRFSRVAKKVSASTKKMRKQFKGLKLDLGFLKSKFLGLAGVIGAGLGFKKLISEGANYQEQIADLSAITGAAGKDLKFLSDQGLLLAKSSKISATKVAESFKLIASAKDELLEDPKALVNVTKQVLLLSNASGVDLATAADTVTQSLNQFGKGAEFAARFVDILAAGAKFGSSEVEDTGQAVTIAGPAARAAGLSFLQLNAALQATAKGGIKGARAGTALNSIFSRLRTLGFNFKKLGLEGVFDKIAKKLSRIKNDTRRAKEEARLFGLEHAKVGLALVNNRDLLTSFEKKLKASGVAEEQATVRLNTFNAKLRGLGITINEKLIKVFLKLEKKQFFTNMAKDMAAWIEKINADDIKKFADSIMTIAKAIGALARAMAKLINFFPELGDSLSKKIVPERLIARMLQLRLLLTGGVGGDAGDQTKIKAQKKLSSKITAAPIERGRKPFKLASFGPSQKSEPDMSSVKKTIGIQSKADVNILLRAPSGTIESVKATAKTPNLNVGVNMVPAI